MSAPVDSRISPALDPETYRAIEGYTDETAPFVGNVIHAFTDAYDVLGKLHTARELWQSNPAVTKEGAVVIVKKEADKHQQRVFRRFDLAATDLAATIQHTEGLLNEPLTERAGLGSLNAEVRNHVKAMDRSEREAFMRDALERDDVPTLEAILGAQCFLSGLTPLDHAHYLREYHTKKRPDLVRRLDVMNRFRERLDRIGPILHAQFAKAVGADAGLAALYQQADDRAKAALKIEPTA
jgi:hypothetical protein